MSSKFDRAFAEVKLYIPMDSDAWQDFRESKVYASLIQGGLLMVHNAQKVQKGRTNNGKKQ